MPAPRHPLLFGQVLADDFYYMQPNAILRELRDTLGAMGSPGGPEARAGWGRL